MKEIILIPIDRVDGETLGTIKQRLAEIFVWTVDGGSQIEPPRSAYDFKRKQYQSKAILAALRAPKHKEDERILGVTNVDLYAPKLSFVFGEADAERGVALISLWRMRQVYRSLPGEKKLFGERVIKEAMHQLGHTYGLGHCWAPRCAMFPTNSLRDTDKKQAFFCYECHRKLSDKGIIR